MLMPKNLKIALGSIHSEYLKSDCSTLDRIRKTLSNIAIRFHGIARLGLCNSLGKYGSESYHS